jgi:hypothetical protein
MCPDLKVAVMIEEPSFLRVCDRGVSCVFDFLALVE